MNNSTPIADYPELANEIKLGRSASVVFCDDVRREDNGKFILIGVYLEELLLEKLPAQLPPIVIWLDATTPESQPFEKFVIFAYLNEREIFHTADMREGFGSAKSLGEGLDPRIQRMSKVRASFTLPPMLIDRTSYLRVRIETELGMMKVGVLKIGLLESQ